MLYECRRTRNKTEKNQSGMKMRMENRRKRVRRCSCHYAFAFRFVPIPPLHPSLAMHAKLLVGLSPTVGILVMSLVLAVVKYISDFRFPISDRGEATKSISAACQSEERKRKRWRGGMEGRRNTHGSYAAVTAGCVLLWRALRSSSESSRAKHY